MSTRVIVLGGGVAGMSAAQELVERGFEVVVLERRDVAGGKARSIPVVHDGAGTSGYMLVHGHAAPDRASRARRAWVPVLPGLL